MMLFLFLLLIACCTCDTLLPDYASWQVSNPRANVTGIPGFSEIGYIVADFGPLPQSNSFDNSFTINPVFITDPCTTYPSSNYSNNGAIISYVSQCDAKTWVVNAQNSLVSALIVMLPPGVGRIPIWLDGANITVNIPVFAISYEDAEPISNFLKSNPNNTVQIKFIPAGHLSDPEEFDALEALANSIYQPDGSVMTDTLAIQDWPLTKPNPCSGPRISFISCEFGHITSFKVLLRPAVGSIPPQISKLKHLKEFNIWLSQCPTCSDVNAQAGITGALPDMTNCTNLRSFQYSFAGSPAIMTPSFESMPHLQAVSFNHNNLKTIPIGLEKLLKLKVVNLQVNQINSPILVGSKELLYFDISSNQLNYPVPMFSNIPNIMLINLGSNKFFSENIEKHFDNLPSLTSLNLKNNLISGAVPNLFNCSSLIKLDISFNKFNGSIPQSWNLLVNLDTLDFSYNSITGPFDFSSTKLTSLYGQNNRIDPLKWTPGANIWAIELFYKFPPSLKTFNFSSNLIKGPWQQTYLNNFKNLKVYLSDNFIESVPPNFNVNDFLVVDLSFNNLTGTLDGVQFNSAIQIVNFKGNPNLYSSKGSIPPFAQQDFLNYDKNPSDSFICPKLVGSGDYKSLQVYLDASYYNWKNCQCDRGYYQNPPYCQNIPEKVENIISTSFSDDLYGNQRLSSGVDISWIISNSIYKQGSVIQIMLDILPEFKILNQDFSQNPNIISVSSSCPSGFSFNPILLTCSCSPGTKFSFLSNSCAKFDLPSSSSTFEVIIDSSQNLNFPSLLSLNVVNNFAALNFKSKKMSGKHFVANYSMINDCPSDMEYFENSVEGFYISARCEKIFVQSAAIQTTVYVIASLFTSLLGLITFIISKKKNSLIIKSSSYPFCLAMLLSMLVLCASSIFYAITPRQTNAVCHLRPWFTALPLTSILSALLVKADRIRKIFSSKELVVQAISNTQLAKIMSVMLLGQLAILIWFSAGHVSQKTVGMGSGTTAQYLVYSCENSSSSWIIVQFLYIAAFLFAGVVEAWSVRKVPSAFNEGPHIASTLLSLTVLLIILIPVQFMISDNPDALVIIRGLGQILITIVMAFFLFGPKLYYILEGRENDKSMSSMGSSKSSSTSSFGSSSKSALVNIEGFNNFLMNLSKVSEGLKNANIDVSNLSKSFESLKTNYPSIDTVSFNQIISNLKSIKQ